MKNGRPGQRWKTRTKITDEEWKTRTKITDEDEMKDTYKSHDFKILLYMTLTI
jgi:NH3-dependent NAD+ synthetase